jgi:nucleotide-binding universal stress UspA family protein
MVQYGERSRFMNKILVGIDGSEGSEYALNKAIMLISEYGELILLAVIPNPYDKNFVDKELYEELKKKADRLIKDIIEDIGVHDFAISGVVENGDAAAKIIDIANNLNVDLIMLGSKGASELGHYPIGSVANKVVQYAHKPVMVVR